MRKLLNLILVLFIAIFCCKSDAMTFEEAHKLSDKTPMIVLVYAQWADGYQTYLTTFKSLKATYLNQYNFVELDIASKDAKFFNTQNHIYPNLPYVLMFKEGGRITRFIPRDCAKEYSCLDNKLKSFLQ